MALALLQNRCNVSLFSSDKDERLQKVVQPGYVDYYTQMPQVFKKSRINLNISLKLIQSGVPLRVFDVLASGGFLMTNFQPEIVEMFVPGEELVITRICRIWWKNQFGILNMMRKESVLLQMDMRK